MEVFVLVVKVVVVTLCLGLGVARAFLNYRDERVIRAVEHAPCVETQLQEDSCATCGGTECHCPPALETRKVDELRSGQSASW